MIENFKINSSEIDKIKIISDKDKKFRLKNLELFNSAGFPTKSLEDWKFSDLKNILIKNFKSFNTQAKDKRRQNIDEGRGASIAGIYNKAVGKGKVSPTIKSVKPSPTVMKKGAQASVDKVKSDEYRKRYTALDKAEGKIKSGKQMMKEGQKSRKKMIFKMGGSITPKAKSFIKRLYDLKLLGLPIVKANDLYKH